MIWLNQLGDIYKVTYSVTYIGKLSLSIALGSFMQSHALCRLELSDFFSQWTRGKMNISLTFPRFPRI